MDSALLSVMISGLVLGSLYALVASGLSLTWSTLGIFNFGHGAFMTLGAYVAWSAAVAHGMPLAVAASVSFAVTAVLALLFGLAFVAPFIARHQGELVVMVTTLSAATIASNATQLIWGPQIKQLPTFFEGTVHLGSVVVGPNQFVAIIVTPLLLGALVAMLRFTRIGLAIRAVEQNRRAARLAGIRPMVVYAIILVVSSLLACLAGILLGGVTFLTPTFGNDPLLKAFVVVIFGGLARVSGAAAGAYTVGMLEAFSTYYFGLSWMPIVIFGAMIAIMLVRPEGLVSKGSGT
jgi:branched-chain amino acid transport system permease protein